MKRLGFLVLCVVTAAAIYLYYSGGVKTLAPVEAPRESAPVQETDREKVASPSRSVAVPEPPPAKLPVQAEGHQELPFDEALAFARKLLVDAGDIRLRCSEGTTAKPLGEYAQCVGADGRRHGLYLRKNQKGQLRQRGYFRADQRWGAFINYDGEGRATKLIEWRNNQMNGEDVAYFPDGAPARKMTFKDGKPHGVIEDYGKNGDQYALHTYADGKRHGRTWILKEGELGFVSGGCYARGELLWKAADIKEAMERACP